MRDDEQDATPEDLKVSQLSEAALIARFSPLLRPLQPGESAAPHDCGPYELLGPGDDCAVVAAPDGRFVITTDTQVQDQDFQLQWPSGVDSTGFDTGYKCATQNLADVAAMGAVPSAMVVSLTLPPDTPVRWVEDFARGLRAGTQACGAHTCRVVGGDLGAGRELSATATVTGDLQGREPVRRTGARPGDRLVLAGTVGRAAAGLALLLNHDFVSGRDPALDALTAAQLRPSSPTHLGAELARAGATSMIDVSDGLIRDLTRVAEASDVLVRLDPRALEQLADPLRPAGKLLGTAPVNWVLHGGEDHGLLCTVPAHLRLPPGVCPIGSVLASSQEHGAGQPRNTGTADVVTDRVWISDTPASQLPAPLRGQGWDHFESADGI